MLPLPIYFHRHKHSYWCALQLDNNLVVVRYYALQDLAKVALRFNRRRTLALAVHVASRLPEARPSRAMTESSSSEKKNEGEVCYWCGIAFRPEVRHGRPVCPRCYRLLTGAGVKDEEIFGEGRHGDKGGGGKEAADG